VTFYIHNLTFIWLTDVLVLQLICTGSSNGTEEVPGDRSPETLKEVDTGQLAIADAKPKGCQVIPNCDDLWSAGG